MGKTWRAITLGVVLLGLLGLIGYWILTGRIKEAIPLFWFLPLGAIALMLQMLGYRYRCGRWCGTCAREE